MITKERDIIKEKIPFVFNTYKVHFPIYCLTACMNRVKHWPARAGKSKNSNENNTQCSIIPFEEIYKIGENLNIWLINTRSISGLTSASLYTKDRIIFLIQNEWPDIVILIETNHVNSPNILGTIYDNFYTQPSKNMGIIILTKKILACKPVNKFESRGLVLQSLAIEGYRIIACYCPYADLILSTIDYIKQFAMGKWIVCGDFEQFGEKIIEKVGAGYWVKPKISRRVSQMESSTEYIGSFYSNLEYEIGEQISDHFLLKIKMNTIWNGIYVKYPCKINRKFALNLLSNEKSNLNRLMRRFWPYNSFKEIAKGIVPKKNHSNKNMETY